MLDARRLRFVTAIAGFGLTAAIMPATAGLAADFSIPSYMPDSAMVSTVPQDAAALDQAIDDSDLPQTAQATPDTSELECMAKVVLHEAGNQPYDGKVAVAETLKNRLAARRFGGSICEVVNQPGQFFRTAAYNPDRDGAGWTSAMQIARAVLSGDATPVAHGAMFFRSAAHSASGFFRSRTQVASVGAHIFYR